MSKNIKQKEVTIYSRITLFRILWRAVLDCFVICVVTAAVLIGIILFFNRHRFSEYFPIPVLIFCFMLITTVIYPMVKSYLFIKHQEQVTGRKYCECTDYNLPPEEREWFIGGMGNKRVIINRFYIKKVNKIWIREDEAEGRTSKWYQVEYENCLGQKKHFPLEKLKSEVERFSLWNNTTPLEIPEEEDLADEDNE